MQRRRLCLATCLLAAAAGAQTAPDHSALRRLAEQQLAELARRQPPEEPRQIMGRNLSRYFASYIVPTSADDAARLLGTLERMADQAAHELHGAASTLAREAGAATVQREQLVAVLEQTLPAAPTPWGELVFFPLAPIADRVTVEIADLQAFRDTAVVWQRLLAHAEAAAADPALLTLAPEALSLLADGLNAYALLVLRLGGGAARAEYAEVLASHHLREAGRQIAARATAHAAGTGAGQQLPLDAPPGSLFRDVTEASGVRFRHTTAPWLTRFRRYGPEAPTFSGGGVTAGDTDGDGWDDLLFCGGAGCSLFRNRGDATFEDVTAQAGIAVPGEARMALVADFDNDGWRDLFLLYAAEGSRLFRNLGEGRFQDVTEASGLMRKGDIGGGATAADFDGDGLLDLYVANFGNYLADENPWSPTDSRNGQPNRLFRNVGDLRFEEITAQAGEGVGNTGWAQAVSHVDYDADGDQDLFIANDFGRDELLANQGDGTFRSAGKETGSDDAGHGMNVAFAELNRDGFADILVTNIWFWEGLRRKVTETNGLFLSERRPDGSVGYRRSEDEAFLARDTGWAWGALFLDVENDGDDDLFVANGFTDYLTFVQYRAAPDDPERFYPINNGREPNVFFRNDGGGIPNVVVEGSGAELPGLNSRGVAALDSDRDGDLDLAVSTFHAEAHLLRNDAPRAGTHWLEVDLVGDPERGVARDAFGARVVARRGDLYVWRSLAGGEGYISQSSHLLHLGLGQSESVDLEVVWPGNQTQLVPDVPADQRIRIRQGVEGFEQLPSGPPAP